MGLKILSIQYSTYPDDSAGVYNVVYNLHRRLVAKGHKVHLIVSKIRRDLPERESIEGMSCYRISGFLSYSVIEKLIKVLLEVRKVTKEILNKEGIDLFHIHNPLMGIGSYLVSQTWGIPKVYHFHSSWFQEERKEYVHKKGGQKPSLIFNLILLIMKGIEYFLLRSARRIIVLSDYSRDLVVSLFGIPREKILKISGGVDGSVYFPTTDKKKVRESLGLSQDKIILFTVRALIARTGIEELIVAFSKVVKVRSDIILVIGGRGRLRDRIEEMIREKNLSETVRLVGFIPSEKLPSYYQAADIFILPTQEQEGFGLVTVEALASGTPVLATPVGGTKEILEPLDPELLFDSTIPEAIARGILFWVQQPERLDKVRQQCRDYVMSQYSWDTNAHNLEREFNDLVKGK